jgi:hypothetical protein
MCRFISRPIRLKMRKFSGKVLEKIKTYILYSVTFFSPENRAVYEDVEKYGGARRATDDIMRRMCFACR